MVKSIEIIKSSLLYAVQTILNSYAVVFFSNNLFFGALLLTASFIDSYAGLCGLIGLVSANIFAGIIRLSKENIRKGYHGYDAMLVSCGLAHYYAFSSTLLIIIICVGIFSILISLFIHGILHKYGLPTLSFPFLISIWLFLSAIPSISTIELHPSILYDLGKEYHPSKSIWFDWTNIHAKIENLLAPLPKIVAVYFKSLSSLFFQTNVLSGILISLGLLIYSRIAFSLSVIGYLSAFYFYPILGGDIADFYTKFIGLNFIFTAIALGGIYLIPSISSYLTAVFLTPLVIVFLFGSSRFLFHLDLGAYSLPFTIITLLFLYALHYRNSIKYLNRVVNQTYSPENNLYSFHNTNQRLSFFKYFPIHLPFWGQWTVSQAHDGKITHLGDWSKAFDFVVEDNELKTYQSPGLKREDFYCYNKPVVAPADGYVSAVLDTVEENEIKGVNTKENWGNSIVIYHTEGLYSQISHLKKDSIKVSIGDFVKKGDVIASCGNSGRSPEPHIHFQMQSTPEIGAKTLNYPLAYYLLKDKTKLSLKMFDYPKEGDIINGIETNSLLVKSFNLLPGKKISWNVNENGLTTSIQWEVFTDSYNQSYLYCSKTKSFAYFYTDENMFLFTDFYGSKKSLLYHFYLANYKVVLGYYPNLDIIEKYPLGIIKTPILRIIQDFMAPFYMFLKSNFTLSYTYIDDENLTNHIVLNSVAKNNLFSYTIKTYEYNTELKNEGLYKFSVQINSHKIEATCDII